MIRKIFCWLGDLLHQDWHEWVLIGEERSEYEPENLYTQEYCKHCGKFVYGTKHYGKDKENAGA